MNDIIGILYKGLSGFLGKEKDDLVFGSAF